MSRSHPVDNAGFLSFSTFAWMTPMMWGMFRNKLDISSLNLSPFDVADSSAERSNFLVIHGGATFYTQDKLAFQAFFQKAHV